ncbi:MAG: hypothetical protein J0H53_05430 [Rhizobiales bacterium]|nr:hypothetical protein [Hyphomicrobiales bacterium]
MSALDINDLVRVEITIWVAGKPVDPAHELAADACDRELTLNLGADEPDSLVSTLTEIAEAAEHHRLYGWLAQEMANFPAGAGEIVAVEDHALTWARKLAKDFYGLELDDTDFPPAFRSLSQASAGWMPALLEVVRSHLPQGDGDRRRASRPAPDQASATAPDVVQAERRPRPSHSPAADGASPRPKARRRKTPGGDA